MGGSPYRLVCPEPPHRKPQESSSEPLCRRLRSVLPMSLTHWKRALALGFLSWLLPFLFSFLAFPLKKANAPLFSTVMYLALILVAAPLRDRYFRDIGAPRVSEAAILSVRTAFRSPQPL